jgi:FKBP-type peptidyl-prolyl cis-trans isomerase
MTIQMKKKWYVLGGIVIVGISMLVQSCGKTADTGCTPATIESEKAQMAAFCTANNINYQTHSSGLLYEVVAPGTGSYPKTTSTVSTFYIGKLLNGTKFDETPGNVPATFSLSNVIEGWKIGIPLIKTGGKIKLVIPSALAYSCVGSGSIAPNSPLYFEVTLVAVQ